MHIGCWERRGLDPGRGVPAAEPMIYLWGQVDVQNFCLVHKGAEPYRVKDLPKPLDGVRLLGGSKPGHCPLAWTAFVTLDAFGGLRAPL